MATETKGAEKLPANFDAELGSASSPPIRDVVPELATRRQATQTYDRMARTDAVSSVSLRSAKVPVLAADYYFEPANSDEDAVNQAEFCDYNLFEGLRQPWLVTAGKILKKYQHGFSILEPVYEQREWRARRKGANTKSYTMLRKLGYRPATTIEKIEYDDDGGPIEIIQNAIRKGGRIERVTIPIEKAIIFPLGDSDDLMGDSLLRSAYPHWYYKTHLYKIDAIQKERHGIGVPKGTLPPGFGADDKKAMDELLANLRTNERAHMTLPPGYVVEFAKLEGQLVDVLESASKHDLLIMLNVMAEFMMLGVASESGGRATSAAQLDIFYKAEWYIASLICDYINMFLIPKLILYNFETDQFPKMRVRQIGQSKELQQMAAALANAFDKEIITPDMETEQWARKLFDMPEKKEPRPEPVATPSTNGKVSGIGDQSNDSTVRNPQGGNTPKGTDVT